MSEHTTLILQGKYLNICASQNQKSYNQVKNSALTNEGWVSDSMSQFDQKGGFFYLFCNVDSSNFHTLKVLVFTWTSWFECFDPRIYCNNLAKVFLSVWRSLTFSQTLAPRFQKNIMHLQIIHSSSYRISISVYFLLPMEILILEWLTLICWVLLVLTTSRKWPCLNEWCV